ncbi:MAG: O-antigen ligase family protein [Actinomycetota bacterium]
MVAIWLVGLAPAVFLPGALNRFVFIKLSLGAAALACALMAGLPGRLQRGPRILLVLGGVTLGVSALLGQAPLAQLIGRAPRYEGLVALSVYVGAVLIGAWLLGPGANPVLRAHLVRATAVAASLIAVVAVLETLGLHPLATSTSRPGSLLGNATEQGAFGAGVVGLCLHAVARRDRAAIWAVGAGGVLVVTSASRGALLGLVAAVAVTVILGAPQVRRVALAGLGVGAVAALALPLTRHRLLMQSPLSGQTVTGRAQEWAETLHLIGQHPVLGVGPSGFLDASPSVQSAGYVRLAGAARLDSPHSLPLQIADAGGVVLLLLAAALSWLLVRSILTLRRDAIDGPWAIGAAAAIAGWGTVLLTHFTAPGSTPLFCLLAGSLLAQPRQGPARRVIRGTVAGAAAVLTAGLLLAATAEIPLRGGLAAQQGGDAAAALQDFGAAHALRPWDADLDAQIAHALIGQPAPGQPATVVDRYLGRARAAFPQDPWVLTDAGLHAGQGGKLTEALTYLDQAHRVAPNDPEVYLIRGQVRSRANNTAGAIADLRASASLTPKSPVSLRVLATVYRQAGQTTQADAAQAQAAALTP